MKVPGGFIGWLVVSWFIYLSCTCWKWNYHWKIKIHFWNPLLKWNLVSNYHPNLSCLLLYLFLRVLIKVPKVAFWISLATVKCNTNDRKKNWQAHYYFSIAMRYFVNVLTLINKKVRIKLCDKNITLSSGLFLWSSS